MITEAKISKALSEDSERLSRISIDTFEETFAAQNTRENMDLFLNESFNAAAVLKELNDETINYYMAFVNGNLAGYVKIREGAHSSFNDLKSLEIGRIYVYNRYQGQRIGAALMQFVINYASVNNFRVIWLGVWEHNPKAIKFYKKWGFEIFGEHVFRLGTDDQSDLLMKKYI